MRHLCRLCNKIQDESQMKFTPTEFFSDGKPIMNSRIWYCNNCIKEREEPHDEVINEFQKIVNSPEFNVVLQHMFTQEFIDLHDSMAKPIIEEPDAKDWEVDKCIQELNKIVKEVPVQTIFVVATHLIVELIIGMKHKDLYPEIFSKR